MYVLLLKSRFPEERTGKKIISVIICAVFLVTPFFTFETDKWTFLCIDFTLGLYRTFIAILCDVFVQD